MINPVTIVLNNPIKPQLKPRHEEFTDLIGKILYC